MWFDHKGVAMKRPKSLNHISLALLALGTISLSHPLLLQLVSKNPQPLSLNLVSLLVSLGLISLSSAYLIRDAHKSGFLVFPVGTLIISLMAHKFLEPSPHYNFLIMCCLVMVTISASLLRKNIIRYFHDPDLRKWLHAHRKNISYKVEFDYLDSHWECQTFDISDSGAFIKMDREKVNWLEGCKNLQIKLNIDDTSIDLDANTVRFEKSPKGKYPVGVGVSFIPPKTKSTVKKPAKARPLSSI